MGSIVSGSRSLATRAPPPLPTCSLPSWREKELPGEYSIECDLRIVSPLAENRIPRHTRGPADVLVAAARIVGESRAICGSRRGRVRVLVWLLDQHFSLAGRDARRAWGRRYAAT